MDNINKMDKVKSGIPNFFTFSNLACGILSLMMSSVGTENYVLASVFIISAALFDRYDGRIARALNVDNDLGKQLDSLSDVISFGVAPAILIFNMYNMVDLGLWSYLILVIFPISGAYRLARYNITKFSGVFMGIPITLAGVFLAIYALIVSLAAININVIIPIILLLLLSYLMVSTIQFKKV